MGTRAGTFEHPLILAQGQTSTRLVAPDTSYRRIHNMVPTDSGGLRSIRLPIPFVTNAGVTPTEGTQNPAAGSIVYGEARSVFHATVGDGARVVLLAHIGDQIWEFLGWEGGWRVLIAAATDNPILAQNLVSPLPTDFPTQWVKTPTGVVIVPSGGQACFYDGTVCLQLGYTDIPSPPVGLGPQNSGTELLPDLLTGKAGVNDMGYALDGLHAQGTGMPVAFGRGRLGTVVGVNGMADPTTFSDVSGYLLPAIYRASVQFLDIFGNLSPLSPVSNDVVFDRQPAMMAVLNDNFEPDLSGTDYQFGWTNLDHVKKQAGWVIPSGPRGTVGRILYRSWDITGKGDSRLREVPADASSNASAFATLPDNVTHFLPDNIPDEWLINLPLEVERMPPFRLACAAFGRLVIANTRADPGAVWFTEIGRYGTVLKRSKFYVDAVGSEVTGLCMVADGLLIMTRRSVSLVNIPSGADPRPEIRTIDTTRGCEGPGSIQILPRSGKAMWLGRNGFYSRMPGQGVVFEWDEHGEDAVRFNLNRLHLATSAIDPRTGQYRCWLSQDATPRNTIAWCYDERFGWTSRDDVEASAVTVTDDATGYMVVAGRKDVGGTPRNGIWVLDVGAASSSQLITGWQRATRSNERARHGVLELWLRETQFSTDEATSVRVSFERDYRVGPIGTAEEKKLYPDEGTPYRGFESTEPHAWGSVIWGDATFRERRPFWLTVNTEIPECEVWRMRLNCDVAIEFMGYTYEEQPQTSGGAAGYR
jgi:hypothetical protein